MMHTRSIRTGRAALGVAMLALVAACSDAPSAPPRTAGIRLNTHTAADREALEVYAIRSRVMTDGVPTIAHDFSATARNGVAMVDAWRFGAPSDAGTPPVPLRVEDAGPVPAAIRGSANFELHLPDGRAASVSRESSPDGEPLSLTVRIGDDEWRWQRTWQARNGRHVLRNTVVETRRHGRLMTRATISVDPRHVARAVPAVPFPFSTEMLRRHSARFGSLAAAMLLPRAAHAQTDAGKACYSAVTSLSNAWVGWRSAVVWWSFNVAFGSPGALAVATMGLFSASAIVDNAQAAYIDCYVAAASAGVTPNRIAVPPSEEQAY